MAESDFLKPTNFDRKKYRPESGKMLDKENQELDFTEMLKRGFNFDQNWMRTMAHDYFVESAFGNIPNITRRGSGGGNPSVNPGIPATIWPQTGLLEYLTSEQTLLASSSDDTDNHIYAGTGKDGDYENVTRLVTINGQTPVAMSGPLLTLRSLFNIGGGKNVGDVYIYESDATVINGVPQESSKIKLKLLAGTNTSTIASYTVTAGHTAYIHQISGSSNKSKDVEIAFRFKAFGGDFSESFPFHINETDFNFFDKGFLVPEKSIVDFIVRSDDTNARISLGFEISERPNTV